MDDDQLALPTNDDVSQSRDSGGSGTNGRALEDSLEMKGQDTVHRGNETTPSQSAGSPLPNDGDTPFSPASSPQDDTAEGNMSREIEMSHLDDTHQVTDTGLDPMETYDEGLTGSAEAAEPNAGNAVVDYKKDEGDTR